MPRIISNIENYIRKIDYIKFFSNDKILLKFYLFPLFFLNNFFGPIFFFIFKFQSYYRSYLIKHNDIKFYVVRLMKYNTELLFRCISYLNSTNYDSIILRISSNKEIDFEEINSLILMSTKSISLKLDYKGLKNTLNEVTIKPSKIPLKKGLRIPLINLNRVENFLKMYSLNRKNILVVESTTLQKKLKNKNYNLDHCNFLFIDNPINKKIKLSNVIILKNKNFNQLDLFAFCYYSDVVIGEKTLYNFIAKYFGTKTNLSHLKLNSQ